VGPLDVLVVGAAVAWRLLDPLVDVVAVEVVVAAEDEVELDMSAVSVVVVMAAVVRSVLAPV
jgi:hypothetical protein